MPCWRHCGSSSHPRRTIAVAANSARARRPAAARGCRSCSASSSADHWRCWRARCPLAGRGRLVSPLPDLNVQASRRRPVAPNPIAAAGPSASDLPHRSVVGIPIEASPSLQACSTSSSWSPAQQWIVRAHTWTVQFARAALAAHGLMAGAHQHTGWRRLRARRRLWHGLAHHQALRVHSRMCTRSVWGARSCLWRGNTHTPSLTLQFNRRSLTSNNLKRSSTSSSTSAPHALCLRELHRKFRPTLPRPSSNSAQTRKHSNPSSKVQFKPTMPSHGTPQHGDPTSW